MKSLCFSCLLLSCLVNSLPSFTNHTTLLGKFCSIAEFVVCSFSVVIKVNPHLSAIEVHYLRKFFFARKPRYQLSATTAIAAPKFAFISSKSPIKLPSIPKHHRPSTLTIYVGFQSQKTLGTHQDSAHFNITVRTTRSISPHSYPCCSIEPIFCRWILFFYIKTQILQCMKTFTFWTLKINKGSGYKSLRIFFNDSL